jgi:hypothetical protein
MRPDWYKYNTHCHVCGTAGSGKSKFCESCLRAHSGARTGFTLFDWHGTLYRDMIRYLAYIRPKRKIYLLNFSEPTDIIPYNPFALPEGWDLSAHISQISQTIAKIWGVRNFDETPTLERTLGTVLAASVALKVSLRLANTLLWYPRKELRETAIAAMAGDDYTDYKQDLCELQYRTAMKEFIRQVESTRNRLARFTRSKTIRLFTGLPSQFSVSRAIEERAIVLVNLRPSKHLSQESARIFAALLLADFLRSAYERTTKPIPHFLYLDECENYLTPDAASMLDEARKSGLRLTFIHHNLGQEVFRLYPAIADSLRMNAQIKAVFQGLPYEQIEETVPEFLLPRLNKRWKKNDTFRTETTYIEEGTFTTTEVHGDHGDSTSESHGSRLVPYQSQVKDGQIDWSREEKLSMLAEEFQTLQRGECFLRLGGKTYRYRVPFVRRYLRPGGKVLEYKQSLLTHHIPIHEAEARLKEAERTFLERGNEYAGSSRPKRKAYLHPQKG